MGQVPSISANGPVAATRSSCGLFHLKVAAVVVLGVTQVVARSESCGECNCVNPQSPSRHRCLPGAANRLSILSNYVSAVPFPPGSQHTPKYYLKHFEVLTLNKTNPLKQKRPPLLQTNDVGF
ncbi:hypothetical protein PR003_g23879 [Phytophthora rubi]|uniref:Uncharacterized protein n=1 Tax=Phytophthora rubi TaxID=129364 RepID=A0A6A3ITH5_9STRA|nr:hypothetical protein PR002_g23073 [Phytophthora rubi]KAE8986316.1 hypothetical protein PR001_g22635 [Phytophthora rubi]KAE9295924.1 hypothetical protein PR003_g23879 [Phytophthora rubi]